MFDLDWAGLFMPSVSVVEIFIRGTLIYLMLLALLRFTPNRMSGTIGVTDLLLIVLLANAVQNSLVAGHESLTDGAVLVLTIITWSFTLNWLGYRFPRIQRLITPAPLPLVKDGHVFQRNMRKELITEGELMTQLREQGVDDIAKVKMAHMEGDGRISVVVRDGYNTTSRPDRRTG
jgi:uncharacterized membrane protein YcaP (DUF421 family)